jgi:hypothetical protein
MEVKWKRFQINFPVFLTFVMLTDRSVILNNYLTQETD